MEKLIFFIHGVAVRNSNYAEPLPTLIKNALNERNKELPYIYKGFWGNYSSEMDEFWTLIDRDFTKKTQQNLGFDPVKYQKARRGLQSRFVGDIFSYLNTDIGQQIRRAIYSQLNQILNTHVNIREIYFVTHSFGTVILWDILFSKRFSSSDPASDIQALLRNRISLQGIVTMGSPIAMINMALGTTPSNIQDSLRYYSTRTGKPLCWLNFIDISDRIAYPVCPLFQQVDHTLITVEDIFDGKENYLEKVANKVDNTVQFLIQKNADLQEAIAMLSDIFDMPTTRPNYFEKSIIIREGINVLPGIISTPTAHSSYFKDSTIAHRIATMIYPQNTGSCSQNTRKIAQDTLEKVIAQDTLEKVIFHLNRVPGMTRVNSEFQQKASQKLNFTDEVVNQFNIRDNSRNTCGFLVLTRNIIQVHHVAVFDYSQAIQFFGYVGLIHGEGLCNAVRSIQAKFDIR
ncbi:hypothetical protein [Spirulina major]|uniref:hypothetical protein n=1 Tax=Spirulina major TaxID=270636 RepID=UPI0009325D4F|nr:hypothetical protein [Spirulina major]